MVTLLLSLQHTSWPLSLCLSCATAAPSPTLSPPRKTLQGFEPPCAEGWRHRPAEKSRVRASLPRAHTPAISNCSWSLVSPNGCVF